MGKEQFARYIYENSARARQSFIGINCGAIPASLIESELFGYEKGAFTGASKEGKMGVFESTDKGTVFLDEVGDLPLEMQVHLLRVLQEMQVRRVGGVRSISWTCASSPPPTGTCWTWCMKRPSGRICTTV